MNGPGGLKTAMLELKHEEKKESIPFTEHCHRTVPITTQKGMEEQREGAYPVPIHRSKVGCNKQQHFIILFTLHATRSCTFSLLCFV